MKTFFKRSFVPFLLFVLLVGSAVGVWQGELFRVKEIHLSDFNTAESSSFQSLKPRVESRLAPFMHQPLWQFSVADIIDRVKKEAWVKKVRVNRSFFGELKVWIQPREVAALIMAKKKGLLPVSFDGSLLPAVTHAQAADAPFLSGGQFLDDLELRQRAIEVIESLPAEGKLSREKVSEIFYHPKEGFTLWMMGGGMKVLLGQRSSAQKIKQVTQSLQYLQLHQKVAKTIDARFKTKVLVKERE